jgi:hypothetical protein
MDVRERISALMEELAPSDGAAGECAVRIWDRFPELFERSLNRCKSGV